MTPDKRLNQIESVIANVAQKVDRLIDTTGTILNETSKIQGIEETVAQIPIIAANVSELNTKVSAIEVQVDKISGIEAQVAKIPGIEAQVAKIPGIEAQVAKIPGIEAQVAKIPGIEATVSVIPAMQKNIEFVASGLAMLTISVNEFKDSTEQRFAFLTDEISGIKQTQSDILALLKEKL